MYQFNFKWIRLAYTKLVFLIFRLLFIFLNKKQQQNTGDSMKIAMLTIVSMFAVSALAMDAATTAADTAKKVETTGTAAAATVTEKVEGKKAEATAKADAHKTAAKKKVVKKVETAKAVAAAHKADAKEVAAEATQKMEIKKEEVKKETK